MALMRCPNCGALSAATQKMCPQCETRLDQGPIEGPAQGPPQAKPVESEQVCKQCKHANVFAPLGVKLAAEDVWCTLCNAAKPADASAPACFEWSFTWRREESLD
jgi:hypothetical protein